MSEQARIRLLLVDDHEIVRAGLKLLLSRFDRIELVGEAGTAAGALAAARELQPDVLLLDLRLPDGSGLDVCREVQRFEKDVRVLVLTSFADEELVLQAAAAGADGYLLKEIDADRLIESIERVAAGQSILDPGVTRAVMNRLKDGGQLPARAGMELLSAQEKRVLALVAEGKTNKEVGVALGLSDKTVKNYLSNALEKLGLSRRSQAAAFYVQHLKP